MLSSLFGKYRFLVISIALFLIFDLGVLTLNFYTAGQIAEQTERINLAGRQRTLTQQMSKATLYIKSQKLQQWVYQSGLSELREHYETFDATLTAFREGGEARSAETGEVIAVDPVLSEPGKHILTEADELWIGFKSAIEPLTRDILVTDAEIIPASRFIADNNLKLFEVMNRLTEHFTEEAESQTQFLRLVQVAGITLATINFFVILFHFLRQLRRRDRRLEQKQSESDQILGNIREGVFLVHKNGCIGEQYSAHLEKIFNTRHVAGRNIKQFLLTYFSKTTAKSALEFLALYKMPHINPELIGDVNPLHRVAASVSDANGEVQRKFLDFSFAPVSLSSEESDSETGILVTVSDVTSDVLLEEQAETIERQAEQQLQLFSRLIHIAPNDLVTFLNDTERSLDNINQLLKGRLGQSNDLEPIFSRILRHTHQLKGNAAALNFTWMAEEMHEIETLIEWLRGLNRGSKLDGRDVMPLVMKLKVLYDHLDAIKELQSKLQEYGVQLQPSANAAAETTELPAENSRWFQLPSLARDIAGQEGVTAFLHLRGFNKPLHEKVQKHAYPIAVQLIRNALAHGIETPEERQRMRKPDAGELSLAISGDTQGNYRFLFEDDGRGFNYDRIRAALIQQGMTVQEADSLSKTQLIKRAFADEFSTLASVSQNAGRGVGLSVVWEQLKALGGKLKIRSVKGEFTQFIVDFSV